MVTKIAFKEAPSNVANVMTAAGIPPSMLFDHALLSTTKGEKGDIPFTVGNLMALSAPGKGLKKNTTENPKDLAANVNKHGPALTREFIKIVKNILKHKVGDAENLNKDIKYIQEKWNTEFIGTGKKMLLPEFKNKLKKDIKEGEESLVKRITGTIGLPPGMKDINKMIKAIETNINSAKDGKGYYTLQSLGDNKIWDAQNLGGFNVDEDSDYAPLQAEKLGDNGEVPSLVEDFVIKSIPPEGILFLCESALLFGDDNTKNETFTTDEQNEINHLRVCKDENKDGKFKYEKVYSASWNDNDITITEAKIDDLHKGGGLENEDICIKEEDYCVFSVEKGGTKTFVVVVHVNDKVAKKDENNQATTKHWKNFLNNCIEKKISYVVGDTNVTKSKTKKSTQDYPPFNGKYVANSTITEFNILKGREPGNMWKNNQIYKFKETNEADGMVILELSPNIKGGRRRRTKKRRKSRKRKRKTKRKKKHRKGTKKRR